MTNLVEWPVAVCGGFEPAFLAVPAEVLVTAMKSHQKYFTVVDAAGRLLPWFITISNMQAADMGQIRAGNERVLRARLSDARFFWEEDLKIPLRGRVPGLGSVVYQEKLGTYLEKVERVKELARWLAREAGGASEEDAERAAFLCKADLVTGMVGEFPELQGVMGRHYALHAGEKPAVAEALLEAYLPRFAGDALPQSAPRGDPLGRRPDGHHLRDLRHRHGADRFGGPARAAAPHAGGDQHPRRARLADPPAQPRRVRDPRARRQARAPARAAARRRAGVLPRPARKPVHRRRARRWTWCAPFSPPASTGCPRSSARIDALDEIRRREDFAPLAVTFKRVANIVPPGFAGEVDAALCAEPVERDLAQAVAAARADVDALVRERDYRGALGRIAELRPVVDRFFDGVMVMADDPKVRDNRLALLAAVQSLFANLADFRQLGSG